MRKKRKSKFFAPATIYFGSAKNEKGTKQLCVWAECSYSGRAVGPIWAHTDQSIRRALATLTKKCDCGRPYHKTRYVEGRRVANTSAKPSAS